MIIDASSARDDNLDWTNPQCLLRNSNNETYEESKMKINNQTILKKQTKEAKPTHNLKTPLRRQEEGETSNGRTFSKLDTTEFQLH